MRIFDVGGTDVAVHVEDSSDAGRPVVLVHGVGFDHNAWRYQTRFLAARGYRVFAPDLPGHGASGGEGLTTIPEMSGWLMAFSDVIGAEAPVVIGHSMGSLIALDAAAKYPGELSAVVLIATSDRMAVHPELLDAAADKDDHAVQLMIGWMHTGDQRFGGHPSPGSWSAGVTRRLLERHMHVLHSDLAACDSYDPMAIAGDVRSPTLVIVGEEDHMTTAASGMTLANAIGTSSVVVPAVGHMLISESSAPVNDAIVGFLGSLAGVR